MFRGGLASRRSLVPADAFYEWQGRPDGKQPYAIARTDRAPLAFAGLWEGWRDPDGAVLRSFAILTTAANATMRTLHERMPVVLEPSDWSLWLGEAEGDAADFMRRPATTCCGCGLSRGRSTALRSNGGALLDRIDDPDAPPPSDGPAGNNPA